MYHIYVSHKVILNDIKESVILNLLSCTLLTLLFIIGKNNSNGHFLTVCKYRFIMNNNSYCDLLKSHIYLEESESITFLHIALIKITYNIKSVFSLTHSV